MTQASNGDNSGNTGPEPGSTTAQNPFHHWPHAAEHARRHFDPEQIEQHAVRILARGVRTQRLIAFVGAGTSMAYGRLTWADMMDRLHETLNSLGDQLPLWQSVDERLWKRSLQEFRTGGALPLKAQIVDECLGEWEHRQTGGIERAPLHEVAADLLADHRGFLRLWLRTLLKHRHGVFVGTHERRLNKELEELIRRQVDDAFFRFAQKKSAGNVQTSSFRVTSTGMEGVIEASELAMKVLRSRNQRYSKPTAMLAALNRAASNLKCDIARPVRCRPNGNPLLARDRGRPDVHPGPASSQAQRPGDCPAA